MKNTIILILLFGLFSFTKHNPETYSLTITVKNLRNSTGVVQFSLYNKGGSIPDEKFKNYYLQKSSLISNDEVSITFNNLPEGVYAINILHDENENKKIDKGFLLPKEGIGFSNYKSIGLSNRPKFSKAKFNLSEDMIKEVTIIYF